MTERQAASCGSGRGRAHAATLPSRISMTRSAAAATRARVGHDDDRAAERVAQLAQRVEHERSLAASSSPVGSSASTSGARRAAAAAIATRCCSPPDSAPARGAAARARARTRRARRPRRGRAVVATREPQRDQHVLRGAERRPEVVALKDERDLPGAVARRSSVLVQPRRASRPTARTSPADGLSSAAASDSIVLLPQPEGPRTATSSRALDAQLESAQRDGLDRPERKILNTSWNSSAGQSIARAGRSGSTYRLLSRVPGPGSLTASGSC